jgi:hypothetical protein
MNDEHREWDTADAALIEWFQRCRSRLPQSPFALWPWARVSDMHRFLGSLDVDIAAGPGGARARLGALQNDLRRLEELFSRKMRTSRRSLLGAETAAR